MNILSKLLDSIALLTFAVLAGLLALIVGVMTGTLLYLGSQHPVISSVVGLAGVATALMIVKSPGDE